MNSAHRFFLPYKPPYNWDRMLSFLAMRAIPGVEAVQQGAYWRTVRAYPDAKRSARWITSENASGGTDGNNCRSTRESIDGDVDGSAHGSACKRAGKTYTGWIRVANNEQENQLEVDYTPSLDTARLYLIERCRHLFDTKCDPIALGSKLESMNEYHAGSFVAGTRIPGCYDGFEMACRAVLGQQISVKSASTLAGRMATQLGTPLETDIEGLTHLFPTPEDIRALACENDGGIEGVLGPLGIIGTRARTILALAELLEREPAAIEPCTESAEEAAAAKGHVFPNGEIPLHVKEISCSCGAAESETYSPATRGLTTPEATPEEKIAALIELPGIGEWTAHYIAMRSMHYADAFPATDLGIIRFLETKKRKELIAAADKWRPWRAYAVMNMWTYEQTAAQEKSGNATKGDSFVGKGGEESGVKSKKKRPHTQEKQAAGTENIARKAASKHATRGDENRKPPTIATAWYETPFIGRVMVAATDEAIVGLWMEGQKYFGASMPTGNIEENPGHPLIRQAFLWLDRYFAGKKPAIEELPLAPQGSLFRQTIWKLLCEIPYGQTTTYGELATKAAARLGKEHMASLAVGGAVGHNPISIIIPCHRVVGANGSLTGYAGGLDKKIALLAHEGTPVGTFFVPSKGTAL